MIIFFRAYIMCGVYPKPHLYSDSDLSPHYIRLNFQ